MFFFHLFTVTRFRRKDVLFKPLTLFGFCLSRLKPTITFSSQKHSAVCVSWLLFAFKYRNSHYIICAFPLWLFTFLLFAHSSYFIFTKNVWIKVKTYIQGDDERCIIWCELSRDFSLFLPPSVHFSVFFISPPVRFPLCGVPFIEIAMEVVCVWPARAVIEPICRLAPVGLNPGLTALRWLNAFAMFLKPILFLFLSPPSPSLDKPPNVSPCANKFFIEIDALSFHWVGDPQECILHILCYAAWHGRFMCWKKKAL